MDFDRIGPWVSAHSFGTTTPPSPKGRLFADRTRQRSASHGPLFSSSSTTTHAEVLSSLISSLTALSESRTENFRSEHEDIRPETSIGLVATQSCHSVQQNAWYSDEFQNRTDYDIATSPVIGFARRQPVLSKKDKWTIHSTVQGHFQNMSRAKSHSTLQRPKTSSIVEHSNAERYYRDSVVGMPPRPLLESKSSFKMLFSARVTDARDQSFLASSEDDAQSTKPTSIRLGHELRRDGRTPRPMTPPEQCLVSSTSHRIPSNDDTPQNHSNPLAHEEIHDHLIPSRRSSLRPSMGRHSNSYSRKISEEVRDFKSLNIDEDLIKEDDATVRRIRELQQAKEMRQLEWRKESQRSERAAKRMSLPHRKDLRRVGSFQGSQPSIQEAIISDSPSEEGFIVPNASEATDNFEQKEPVESSNYPPLTPIDTPPESIQGFSPSILHSLPSSRKEHRRIPSNRFQRPTSLYRDTSDEIKNINQEVDEFLSSPRFTQRLRHPRTGRIIAFSEVGDPNGFVVICCVGMGLTRYLTTFYHELAKAQKLRIITPDRPGVGESSPYPDGTNTPLAWVDDVAAICSALNIEKFSLLAHSAGAIFALAVALKMPTYVRGRIHLLAPWIPPSQLAMAKNWNRTKAADLPTSHKLLSMLPVSFMKAANSRFLNVTGGSIDTTRRKKDFVSVVMDSILLTEAASASASDMNIPTGLPTPDSTPKRTYSRLHNRPSTSLTARPTPLLSPNNSIDGSCQTGTSTPRTATTDSPSSLSAQARQRLYNTTLAHKTWTLTTLNANPAIDLIICLERRRTIGFAYTDVVRGIVIHHGSKDSRVPVENARWLSTIMRRCELQILPDEGHGLMANATVMSSVLAEIGREWEEWSVVARAKEKRRMDREAERERERQREIRRGPRS